ncbi:transcription repressor OFP12-like [Populus alba x Populus x berolinensis]|uniref:Transcription repressor n=1 Tax=Populus alba x Populus x berolinensis TaxID=444605 RepID=A0AAD6RC67_9ROSI|nr:transcription repressor OFP12-like [Populus alba x Populus x berolinensis]
MAGTAGRNLNLCFIAKIKRPLPPDHQSPSNPLTPDDHSHPFRFKNYNSLYDHTIDSAPASTSISSSSSSSEPDFASVYASQRFFFSSPGSSNSIIESTPSIVTSTESSDNLVAPQPDSNGLIINHSAGKSLLLDGCDNSHPLHDQQPPQLLKSPTVKDSMAVSTYSHDPYMDFRRSMQEMVDARHLVDVKANWEYLHELLSSYLSLNPKSTHKFIVGAFADLLVSLLSAEMTQDGSRREGDFSSVGCGISRQSM